MTDQISRPDGWEPAITVFLCNRCTDTRTGPAAANPSGKPANITIVPLSCLSQLSEQMLLSSLSSGADGILVCGCPAADCDAAADAQSGGRQLVLLHNLLAFIGIEPERITFSRLVAAGDEQLAELVRSVSAKVKALGPATRLLKKIDQAA